MASYAAPPGGYQGVHGYQHPPVAAPPHASHYATKDPIAHTAADGSQRFQPTGCRDALWAALFIAHWIAIATLAIVYGKKHSDETSTADVWFDMDKNGYGLVALFLGAGFVSSFFWLQLMQRQASCLIWFTLLFSVAMSAAFGFFFFAVGAVVPGVIFLIFAALNALYVYFVRDRIEFSATLLSIVSEVIKKYPATITVAYVAILAQAAFLLVWALSAIFTLGTVQRDNQDRDGSDGNAREGVAWVGYVFSFYWSSQVIKNVVHVTVAGSVGTWYFLYPHSSPANPTLGAFKRATWTSFGSICLGSFLVAVVRTLRYIVRSMQDNKNEFVRCMALCLLNCLDAMINWFNTYAFTQVALYGKPYCEAASDAWELIKNRGFDAIINDDLTGSVLAFGALIGGIFAAAVGGICAKYVLVQSPWGVWAGVGFLVGFGMTMVAMEVVSSAVTALFVCFAEDPAALQETKPEVYARFRGALSSSRYAAQAPLLSGH